MSVHVIYYEKRGKKSVKMMRPVTTREEYLALRDSTRQRNLLKAVRNGEEKKKMQLVQMNYSCLPNADGTLAGSTTMSNTVGMDIDHLKPEELESVKQRILSKKDELGLLMLEKSARGEGYHLVFKRHTEMTQEENLQWASDLLGVQFDEGAKDITRVFFTTCLEDLIYLDDKIFENGLREAPEHQLERKNGNGNENKTTDGSDGHGYNKDNLDNKDNIKPQNQKNYGNNNETAPTKEERGAYLPLRSKYADYTYHGHKMVDIIDRYIAVNGEPEVGERHNFYNKMVADFRNICGNSPDVLLDLLPRYDGDDAAAYAGYASQCQSICRKNNNARLPREFYFFLVKNGFYQKNVKVNVNLVDDEDEEEVDVPVNVSVESMPTPPPIIKELIDIAPNDFKLPAINALLPILGTLTSYVRAEDRQNGKTISTSFFSVVYAPPSSGKSFIERYINYLLRDIMIRDEVNDARDAVFARKSQQKSANDKGEKLPTTSIRIMEAKNSEAEFLEKQRNNKGHHMFTYCAEIDQWRKGIRAAGGNKDDMVRIAWDNGTYGQNYKSSNTFKGKVQLFWNVLLAGTDDQVAIYFRNVTNGLVTRCSFMHIDNQQFQEIPPLWKKISKKQKAKVNAFIDRCDALTYAEPLKVDLSEVYAVDDDNFDKEIPWKYEFKPLQFMDIDWIIPTCNKFQKEQCRKAQIDSDEARDTFRRRVGDRGKRLALLCTQLYAKPMTDKDKKACAKWIEWWMQQDLDAICKTFGEKYMQAIQDSALPDGTKQKTILQRLPDEFDKAEVRRVADILGYKTPARKIIYRWVKAGVVEKFAEDRWRKVKFKV